MFLGAAAMREISRAHQYTMQVRISVRLEDAFIESWTSRALIPPR